MTLNQKQFTGLLKEKTPDELLGLLRKWGSEPEVTDPDYLSLLLLEIQSRDLSAKQQADLHQMITSMIQTGQTVPGRSGSYSDTERALDGFRRKRNGSVRHMQSLLNMIGLLVIVTGFAVFISNARLGNVMGSIYVILLTASFSAVLFALSAVIRILERIEGNTPLRDPGNES